MLRRVGTVDPANMVLLLSEKMGWRGRPIRFLYWLHS
jgi:hypothetical protein